MSGPRHDTTPRLTHRGWKARKYLSFRSREKNVLDFSSYRSGFFVNPTLELLIGEAPDHKFWGHRIVEKPGSSLETGQPYDLWQDFHVPVKILFNRLPVTLSGAQEWSVLK